MQRTHLFLGLGLWLGLSLAISSVTAPTANAQNDSRFQRGGAEIILYSDTNFQGEARVYNGDVETLSYDGFNDLARSVEIRGGAWTLCKDRAGRGRCRTIDYSVADLGRIGLDCELTSFYQAAASRSGFSSGGHHGGGRGRAGFGGAHAPVVLFSSDGFEGRSVGINGPTNLRDVRFNDRADSIAIHQGTWIVCTKRNLEGRCEVLGQSVYDLDDIDLDDNISSIAPYQGHRQY